MPALVGPHLDALATELAGPTAGRVARTRLQLGALAGRLVHPGGLTAASRHAGAEPWSTGRARPYAESTLRLRAGAWGAAGGAAAVARHVEAQVERAVRTAGGAVAHTDMFDQVLYTKKPAHAAPIGSLGNRLLAATYFGLTMVRPDGGPPLLDHVSWHKPAAPLVDALYALHANARRAAWLTAYVRRHTWDRGGNGRAVLQWARDHDIPYLTLARGTVYLSSQRRPTATTATQLPIFVRKDVGLGAPSLRPDGTARTPRVVIFPARPAAGAACKKAIRYRTNAELTAAEIATMDTVYKARWPEMENGIKALVAVGFGANRERSLALTTSRGTDGKRARLAQRARELTTEIEALRREPPKAPVRRKLATRAKRQRAIQRQMAVSAAAPLTKGARESTRGELLSKYLTALLYNALALLLCRSPLEAVRAMTPALVRELLLGQPAFAVLTTETLTLWIEVTPDARARPLQRELVKLFEAAQLARVGGRVLRLRLRQDTEGIRG